MADRLIPGIILDNADKIPNNPAMKWKDNGKWHTITYSEFKEHVLKIASFLKGIGIGHGDKVAIYANNMPEWHISDIGSLMLGAISVPIYSTNTSDQTKEIIIDSGAKVVFAGEDSNLDKLTPFKKELGLSVIDLKGDKKPSDHHFKDIIRNQEIDDTIAPALKGFKESDLATIIYTSGTTGEPKGVMLTHGNFFHQVDSVNTYFDVDDTDSSLCFLPLSHVYERAWSYYIFHQGAVNHYLDDHKNIMEYLAEVKPTVMVSVPRLFEKIYSTANERLKKASSVKKILFRWAMNTGRKHNFMIQEGKEPGFILKKKYALADRLVLHKLREIVGGDKKFLSAGGAPLHKEIGEFFLCAGIIVCEGYGLTETSPIISYNRPGMVRFGTVGKPAPFVEVRLGKENEIQVKGPNVMKGYYNKPEQTAEVFEDGWFRTGDVGEFDKDGFIKITDRIKDIIITSNGKNVARQRVELVVGKDHYIEQILAIGNNRKFISALVVPYFDALEEYAKEKGIEFSSRAMLVKKKEIIEFYNKRIEEVQQELAHFEQIKKFTLLPEEFTQAAGEMTPTLKNKKRVIMENYKDLVETMYAEKDLSPA